MMTSSSYLASSSKNQGSCVFFGLDKARTFPMVAPVFLRLLRDTPALVSL